MAFELPPLPYPKDAFGEVMSAETFDYHHGKHHQTYVTNLNKLVEGTEDEGKTLDELIAAADNPSPLFNNAAQHWNHSFFWNCMAPGGGGEPTGEVADAISSAFGSYGDFRTKFAEAATTQFGSGWAWLAHDGSALQIMKTANADLPLKHGAQALVTLDVWEHAYYIDYRNARPKFIDAFLDSLINWDFVAQNLSAV
jgi:Fe-Mn family superoxide dismutase